MPILYTDGVTEASNALEEQFTEPRLLDVVNRHRAETAGAMVERVCEGVMDFVGGAQPSGDLTILAVRYWENFTTPGIDIRHLHRADPTLGAEITRTHPPSAAIE